MSTELPPQSRSPENSEYTEAPADDAVDMHSDPRFQELKRRLLVFAFPMSLAFLAWYLLYVLMSAYARDFMGTKLLGNINVAYVFGLLQFVSTFVIAFVYSRYADKHFDPTADRIRARLEAAQQ